MSYYSLGREVHTTATYSKIAEAVDKETAEMLVDVLNASQQSVQATGLCDCVIPVAKKVETSVCVCGGQITPRA